MPSHIPEWVWIIVFSVLAFAIAYSWGRREGRAAPASAEADDSVNSVDAASFPPESGPISPGPISSTSAVSSNSRSEAIEPLESLPKMDFEDEEDIDPTRVGALATASKPVLEAIVKKIVYDEEAEVDEPTGVGPLIVVWGMAQTDKGLRRKRNEDSILAMPEHGLYVVADGMGGYRGGEIASALAVKEIERAFRFREFAGTQHEGIPRRASELARAMQMANAAICARAAEERELAGMGTTLCAARFSSDKERLYIGHVGDSRMYRLRRGGTLEQLTSDHTMKDLGVTGAGAAHLSRAVGIWPVVPIDVLYCCPRPGDLYLLCSDGLTKMVSDEEIAEIVGRGGPPAQIVESLVSTANAQGGKDNISVIVLRVDSVESRSI